MKTAAPYDRGEPRALSTNHECVAGGKDVTRLKSATGSRCLSIGGSLRRSYPGGHYGTMGRGWEKPIRVNEERFIET